MKKKSTIAILLVASANVAVVGPIEEQIRFRQSAYSFAAWNISKIKEQVVNHPETYNKDSVAAAANAIAAVANSGLDALYGEGTDKGVGWKQTRLKPEFFQKKEEVTIAPLRHNSCRL